MRIWFISIAFLFAAASSAQTYLPGTLMDYTQRQAFAGKLFSEDSTAHKKWMLSKYSGISTSFSFFRGGNATVVAAPLGLQLNRRLNNNLYAFAGVSVAPAYINFNRSFLTTDVNKGYPNNSFLKSNSFGVYSRAELGLMYVNDARTFSISGSIGIERNSYPVMPYNQLNTARPNQAIIPNR